MATSFVPFLVTFHTCPSSSWIGQPLTACARLSLHLILTGADAGSALNDMPGPIPPHPSPTSKEVLVPILGQMKLTFSVVSGSPR